MPDAALTTIGLTAIIHFIYSGRTKGNAAVKTPFSKEFWTLVRTTGIHRLSHWLHSYVYFSYTQQYLRYGTGLAKALPRIPGFLQDWATSSYRGKATPLEDAKKLVQVNLNVPIENLERILPLGEAKSIVYRTGERILVAECVCRKLKKDHCQPVEVCLFVGKDVASFVHKQKPDQSRWITQNEAIEILEETDRRGWSHLTFSRDICNDEFFVICNCCQCCCAAVMLQSQIGIPVLHSSGYRVEVLEHCTGCGRCQAICPLGAIGLDLENTKAVVDRTKCLACGVCVSNCPDKALLLEPAVEGLQPLRLPV